MTSSAASDSSSSSPTATAAAAAAAAEAAEATVDDTSYRSPLYAVTEGGSGGSWWPIVYHPAYNISFGGLEKLHPFDAGKWGRIAAYLEQSGLVRPAQLVQPAEAQAGDLLRVHTAEYLDSLKWSSNVAQVTEVALVAALPNALVQQKVLRPFRFHVGGSVLAAKLALDRGWSINLGGGFHHCCGSRGGGFCAYADITMAVSFLMRGYAGPGSRISRAMIVDLDAHQGNGYARDFAGNPGVYILDAYNACIYPNDTEAAEFITRRVELAPGTGDQEFLRAVADALEAALGEFSPQLVLYNAGTDVMDGDPLGDLRISPEGIIKRDELVFQACRSRQIPVAMVTSGGYQHSNARVIADSILNLHAKGLISGPEQQQNL